jgi:hypothetical protein
MNLEDKEELIVEMSNEIDDLMVELATKHKQHPLNLSSVILARLLVLCKTTGCLEDFQKIIESISDDVLFEANTEVTKH